MGCTGTAYRFHNQADVMDRPAKIRKKMIGRSVCIAGYPGAYGLAQRPALCAMRIACMLREEYASGSLASMTNHSKNAAPSLVGLRYSSITVGHVFRLLPKCMQPQRAETVSSGCFGDFFDGS